MSTTLERTTVEHPTSEQVPTGNDRRKRRAALVGLVVGMAAATALVIVLQPDPAEVPQEIFSPEAQRQWTPPRTESEEIFSPERHRQWAPSTEPDEIFSPEAHRVPAGSGPSDHQLRVEATRGSPGQTPSHPDRSDHQVRVEATRGDPESQRAVDRALIAEGLHGLSPASAQAGPTARDGNDPGLYAGDELTTMRLAREGTLPKELLGTETFVTKRLVNEGRIPAATAR